MKSVRERQISYDIPYTWNLKKNDTSVLTYKTEIYPQPHETKVWLPKGKVEEG